MTIERNFNDIGQLPAVESFSTITTHPSDMAPPLQVRNVGAAMISALVGEQTYGKALKTDLQIELAALIDTTPHYQVSKKVIMSY